MFMMVTLLPSGVVAQVSVLFIMLIFMVSSHSPKSHRFPQLTSTDLQCKLPCVRLVPVVLPVSCQYIESSASMVFWYIETQHIDSVL